MPLDIDIDMGQEVFFKYTENGTLEECVERVEGALKFIVSHGGTTARWRSIAISADMFGTQSAIIDFIRSSPMPQLEHLELMFEGPSEDDEEDQNAFIEAIRAEPLPLFQQVPHELGTVKIRGVPTPFLFGSVNQLHICSLTHIELTFVGFPPELSNFSAMLHVTTQLELLHLDFDGVDVIGSHPSELGLPKIRLHHLREFGLLNVQDAHWSLNAIMAIEAPCLEFLQLDLIECEIGDEELLKYLIDGGDESNPQAAFPTITRLSILFDGSNPSSLGLESLLRAYPNITRLDIPFSPLDALLTKPLVTPKLQYLRVAGCSGSEIKQVVAARARAKLPLKVVESDQTFASTISAAQKKYLTNKVELKFYDPHTEDGIMAKVENAEDFEDFDLYDYGYDDNGMEY